MCTKEPNLKLRGNYTKGPAWTKKKTKDKNNSDYDSLVWLNLNYENINWKCGKTNS